MLEVEGRSRISIDAGAGLPGEHGGDPQRAVTGG
jgi:hypothetical protein